MAEYTQYYLAFLDLLGFKEIIKNRTCSEIVDIFEEIKKQYVISESDLETGTSIPVIPPENIMYYIMLIQQLFQTQTFALRLVSRKRI